MNSEFEIPMEEKSQNELPNSAYSVPIIISEDIHENSNDTSTLENSHDGGEAINVNMDDFRADEDAGSNCSDGHYHYVHRTAWLRAAVLGANDGLVSTSSLMLGITAGEYGTDNLQMTILAGISGLVSGALSMAAGEYVSVYSQRDTEKADIKRERREMLKSPAAALKEEMELALIYEHRGLSSALAKQVAHELHQKSLEEIVKIHARDELGIDTEDLSNPLQASVASAFSFAVGSAVPLLAGGFIHDSLYRIIAIVVVSSFGLAFFGAIGAIAGGAPLLRASTRVLVGGWIAMGVTFGIGRAFGVSGV